MGKGQVCLLFVPWRFRSLPSLMRVKAREITRSHPNSGRMNMFVQRTSTSWAKETMEEKIAEIQI
jgi:hypothetical protein